MGSFHGEWDHFRTPHPCHSFLLTLFPFFIMALFQGLQSFRNKLPYHGSPWATIPSRRLLLHEHIYLLQLKLSIGCSVALHRPQGKKLLHCGLCGILQFSLLSACGVASFLSPLSPAPQHFSPCPKYAITETQLMGISFGRHWVHLGAS